MKTDLHWTFLFFFWLIFPFAMMVVPLAWYFKVAIIAIAVWVFYPESDFKY